MDPFQGSREQLFVSMLAGVPGTWGMGHMLLESLQLAIYECMEGAPLCAPSAPPCFAVLTARARLPGPALLQRLPDLSCDSNPDGNVQELPYVFCGKAEGPSAI